MSAELLFIMVFLIGFLLMSVLYFLHRKKRESVAVIANQGLISVSQTGSTSGEMGRGFYNLALFNEDGTKIAESREILQIPAKAHRIGTSDSALRRVRHLASDLFKGAVSIPNKTVEVVFNQDIQKGLAEGTYTLMRSNSGEVLADAVNSSGKIVGKGRLIESGKARQLASGAFQLVSIAVAQSHLADIEQSLGSIKDSISAVLCKLDNEDESRITGAIDYLQGIAVHMKELRCPEELSQQKRNEIEGIIRESYAWRNKLEKELSSLTNDISNLKDLDTFGTGKTFNKLKELVEDAKPIINRQYLLINLASAINFVTAYLDPAQREFSRVSPASERWAVLINEFESAAKNQSSQKLTKAYWTFDEKLELRKDKIDNLSGRCRQDAIDQQRSYEQLSNTLDKSIRGLIDSDGKVRVAISFDECGEVKDAAIL